MLGLGASTSTTEITFKQNQFFPGEQIRVMLACDNLKCRYDVKSFKFKCFRLITVRDSGTGLALIKEAKMFSFKEPGVSANKSTKREFVFDVPLSLKDDGETETQPLPGSWLGQIFQIDYVLKVFVKHGAWNSVGQGDFVSLPFKILGSPQLIQSDENFRVPVDWRPTVGIAEPVKLMHD